MALSPICTADKVGLIICRGCYWGGLVWGNNILARLVNSVSLRFFHPPSFSIVSPVFLSANLLILSSPSPAFFHCCLSICCLSRRLLPWAVGCACISSLPHLTFLLLLSLFRPATRHTCELNSDVALRVSFTHVWPIADCTHSSEEHSEDVLHTAQFHAQLVN